MAGSYYTQSTVKAIADVGDAADDTLLDLFGGLANQHIDNILEKHDEKIPLQSTNVLNDIKLAADFYTASLYQAFRENFESAKYWHDMYQNVIDGIVEERSIDGESYQVERMSGRGTRADIDELWI